MKKNKRTYLSIGAIVGITIPVITIAACGSSSSDDDEVYFWDKNLQSTNLFKDASGRYWTSKSAWELANHETIHDSGYAKDNNYYNSLNNIGISPIINPPSKPTIGVYNKLNQQTENYTYYNKGASHQSLPLTTPAWFKGTENITTANQTPSTPLPNQLIKNNTTNQYYDVSAQEQALNGGGYFKQQTMSLPSKYQSKTVEFNSDVYNYYEATDPSNPSGQIATLPTPVTLPIPSMQTGTPNSIHVDGDTYTAKNELNTYDSLLTKAKQLNLVTSDDKFNVTENNLNTLYSNQVIDATTTTNLIFSLFTKFYPSAIYSNQNKNSAYEFDAVLIAPNPIYTPSMIDQNHLWELQHKTSGGPDVTTLQNLGVEYTSSELYKDLTTKNTNDSASPFSSVDALNSHLSTDISANGIIYYNLFNIFSNGDDLANENYGRTLGRMFDIPSSLAWLPINVAGTTDMEHPFSKAEFTSLDFSSLTPESLQKLADSFGAWYTRIKAMNIPDTTNSMLSLGLSPYLVLDTTSGHYNILKNGAANPAGESIAEKIVRFNKAYNVSVAPNATILLNKIAMADRVKLIENLTYNVVGSLADDLVFEKGGLILDMTQDFYKIDPSLGVGFTLDATKSIGQKPIPTTGWFKANGDPFPVSDITNYWYHSDDITKKIVYFNSQSSAFTELTKTSGNSPIVDSTTIPHISNIDFIDTSGQTSHYSWEDEYISSGQLPVTGYFKSQSDADANKDKLDSSLLRYTSKDPITSNVTYYNLTKEQLLSKLNITHVTTENPIVVNGNDKIETPTNKLLNGKFDIPKATKNLEIWIDGHEYITHK